MVDTPIPVKKSASPNWWMKGKGAGTELDPSEAYIIDTLVEAGVGGLTDAAASVSVDEDATSRSMIALLKGQKNLLIDVQASLAALDTLIRTTGITYLPIDSSLDDIDVSKMSKGAVTVAHNAITATATSAEVDCRGFNSIMLEISQSAAEAWTYTVKGCMISGGTFVDVYEMANTGALALMTVVENTLNRTVVFKGIPDYVKIVATEVGGTATVTVKVQPFNS